MTEAQVKLGTFSEKLMNRREIRHSLRVTRQAPGGAEPALNQPIRRDSLQETTSQPTPHPEHLPELQRADWIHTDRDCPTTAPQLQQLKPVHSRGRLIHAQAVSGGANRANDELHDIQHMLSIICSHLLTHSGQ
ncbi:hypothetical protein DPX16_4071 [Anabarilius grahami]|uniref:Uncharacterized protein n=1 Tax=Anabarilius grahami TaxID=495550 RepID=A0A3N0XY90_ANAGA|nr:hypothetical protein DPX16_4071 [Anabarilius grahami]